MPVPQVGWAQVFPILEVPFKFDVITHTGRGPSAPQFWGFPFTYA